MTYSKTLSIALCALLLASCRTVPQKLDVPQVDRVAPAEAMVSCPDLTALQDASFRALAMKLDEVSTLYYQCSSKQDELRQWIERGQSK